MEAGKRAPIAAARRVYGRAPLTHCHDYWQFVFPERGRLDLSVQAERGAVTGSRLAVVEAGHEHVCWAERGATCLVVDLAGDFEDDRLPRRVEPAFRLLEPRLRSLRDAVSVELRLGGFDEPLVVDGLARYALATLTAPVLAAPAAASVGGRRIATKARELIDERYRESLSVSRLAAEVGASASHLQRSFKAEHGIGLVSYLLERRLDHAARLLTDTDLAITSVAAESGFDSPSYFSRRFSQRAGLSPLRFRAARRAESNVFSPES